MENNHNYLLRNRTAQAVQYTDPQSVERMVTLWGTRGFNNTPEGLSFTANGEGGASNGYYELEKGDWLVRIEGIDSFGGFRWFTDEEFRAYFEEVA